MAYRCEGVTTFAVPPATYHPNNIEAKSSPMSKSEMDKAEYVSSANAIPNATATDYVKRSFSRERVKLFDWNWALQIAYFVQCRAKYTFDLDSVSVEQIMESKSRD
ncbi:hypothetical protein DD237_008412 [Peronospora effusa]|uniref:Uncharacterized protein n=1 Tax=Peronospora effusa TaxID=542832 RepID=A0A425C2R2_9STRA|nr:hypothetical protein DD237_008412 [Peronospora effusa]